MRNVGCAKIVVRIFLYSGCGIWLKKQFMISREEDKLLDHTMAYGLMVKEVMREKQLPLRSCSFAGKE